MIHDFDLCRLYLGKDEIMEIHAFTSSFTPFYKKIKDHELAVVTMKSKKGVICVITNSRHCSFGYDQRVELFGKKGMLISGNKKENATELFNSSLTNSQKPFLNFFIERYNDAYNIQLKELISLHKNKIQSRSTFEDGYIALKLANAAYKSLKSKKTIKI
jgi:myo-inositol 2-dehydrogenase/D-chiro-inositol 1-dehydrogenase